MPRLIEYITVGICAGYGDGDFRVSMNVRSLSRESFKDLKLAMLSALRCAEDNWLDEQSKKPENQAYTQGGSGQNLADANSKSPIQAREE
jgi:hypothetical protein